MAIQETRTLPAPFIEGLGKDYATELKSRYQQPIDTTKFQPGVAPQHQLSLQPLLIGLIQIMLELKVVA